MASGMVVNWDKTYGMWLGKWAKHPPFFKHPTLPIQFCNESGLIITRMKYLGIDSGDVPFDDAWHQIKEKFQTQLFDRCSVYSTDAGRCLIGNAMAGSINFIAMQLVWASGSVVVVVLLQRWERASGVGTR